MVRLFVDVREPHEYRSGHVEGAINIPLSNLTNKASELVGLSKNAEIILYCRTGSRSNVAVHILKAEGFTNLVNGINKDQVAEKYFKVT